MRAWNVIKWAKVYVCKVNDKPPGSRPMNHKNSSFFQQLKWSGVVPIYVCLCNWENNSISWRFTGEPRRTPHQDRSRLSSYHGWETENISNVNIKKKWIGGWKQNGSSVWSSSSLGCFFSTFLPPFIQPCFHPLLFLLSFLIQVYYVRPLFSGSLITISCS